MKKIRFRYKFCVFIMLFSLYLSMFSNHALRTFDVLVGLFAILIFLILVFYFIWSIIKKDEILLILIVVFIFLRFGVSIYRSDLIKGEVVLCAYKSINDYESVKLLFRETGVVDFEHRRKAMKGYDYYKGGFDMKNNKFILIDKPEELNFVPKVFTLEGDVIHTTQGDFEIVEYKKDSWFQYLLGLKW